MNVARVFHLEISRFLVIMPAFEGVFLIVFFFQRRGFWNAKHPDAQRFAREALMVSFDWARK
jgi:hypothetical protein